MTIATWHIWGIKPRLYSKIKEFLEALPEVEDWSYPSVEKDYRTVHGKKTKVVPLYPGYICLKYVESSETYHIINNHVAFCRYIGKTSEREMLEVFKMRIDEDGKMCGKRIEKGSKVRILGGHLLDGYEGDVVGVTSGGVRVVIPMRGKVFNVEVKDSNYEIVG